MLIELDRVFGRLAKNNDHVDTQSLGVHSGFGTFESQNFSRSDAYQFIGYEAFAVTGYERKHARFVPFILTLIGMVVVVVV